MKKYTMLFAVLSGLVMLMFAAVPQLHVSAQCLSGFACPTAAPPGSNQGNKKFKKSLVATPVPTPMATSPGNNASAGPILGGGPSSNLPTTSGSPGGSPACTGGWLLCGPRGFLWGVGGFLLLLLGGGFVLFRSRFIGLTNPAMKSPIDPCWIPNPEGQAPIAPCWVPGSDEAPIIPCIVPNPEGQAAIDPCWVPGPESQTPINPCFTPNPDSQAPIDPCWIPGSESLGGPELPG